MYNTRPSTLIRITDKVNFQLSRRKRANISWDVILRTRKLRRFFLTRVMSSTEKKKLEQKQIMFTCKYYLTNIA